MLVTIIFFSLSLSLCSKLYYYSQQQCNLPVPWKPAFDPFSHLWFSGNLSFILFKGLLSRREPTWFWSIPSRFLARGSFRKLLLDHWYAQCRSKTNPAQIKLLLQLSKVDRLVGYHDGRRTSNFYSFHHDFCPTLYIPLCYWRHCVDQQRACPGLSKRVWWVRTLNLPFSTSRLSSIHVT